MAPSDQPRASRADWAGRLRRLVPPLALAALGVFAAPALGAWGLVAQWLLVAVFLGWLGMRLGGAWRNASVSLVSIVLVLAVVEAAAIATSRTEPAHSITTPGLNVTDPALGWTLGAPGRYRERRVSGRDGRTIFDAAYTVDAARNRAVAAAPAGPLVAFAGDSITFGTGVNDAETMPQAFADATGRRLRVINLGVAGHGPQQALRALETGAWDARLAGLAVFIYTTAPWHAERTSCRAGHMARAPRYEPAGEGMRLAGTCGDAWWKPLFARIERTATWQTILRPALGGPSRAEVDFYIATLSRIGELVRAKFAAPTVIQMIAAEGNYLERAGVTEAEIMARLRAGGVSAIDASLDPAEFPGQVLRIPGDGHPTGLAHRLRAERLAAELARLPDLAALFAPATPRP
jgi:hypothetical protein